MGTDCKLMKYR